MNIKLQAYLISTTLVVALAIAEIGLLSWQAAHSPVRPQAESACGGPGGQVCVPAPAAESTVVVVAKIALQEIQSP